ncbi:MAG: glycine zipper 2TM domain-containing protein [Limnohabitans sp.]|nr:hypothetical protein [Burkholderiales bacterium]
MKKLFSVIGMLAAFYLPQSQAQEVGRVISSIPIIQQVAVPRQVCTQQQVTTQPPKSGAGALMGAIAGGTVGHAIGRDGLGTAIGMFGGAILGDKIEGAPPPEVKNVQTCSTQNFYESRTVAYNVTYEYAGKQYIVQMPQDPGPSVRLQITPVVSSNPTYNYPPPPPLPAASAVPPPGSAPQSW